ncbi:MAG: hypothetical protein ACFE0O_14835 [Opitutales bacterium]
MQSNAFAIAGFSYLTTALGVNVDDALGFPDEDVHYVFGGGTMSGTYIGSLSLAGNHADYDEYSYSGTAFFSFDDTLPFDILGDWNEAVNGNF